MKLPQGPLNPSSRESCSPSGVFNEVDPCGSTTVTHGDWTKEADAAWGLSGQALHLTLVLETGVSESDAQLAMDARGWLESEQTTVQVAVTISVNRSVPRVCLKKYEIGQRSFNTATRASPPSARVVDEIIMTRENGLTAVTGTLDPSFDKIVGRMPNPQHPRERDLHLSVDDLKAIPDKVWAVQDFVLSNQPPVLTVYL